MKLVILVVVVILFKLSVPAHAADTIRIAYSSVNPHALLVSLAEKRGLYAKYGLSSVVVYCPILGGLKPSPLGDSFSTLSWQYDNVWG